MPNHTLLAHALADLRRNPEQFAAAHERGNCVVLAGPGSGKTKTLTAAMARALLEDVTDPRGVACITYNNECALELESRLAGLGIAGSDRCFIGTVHSFALTQVIAPYARCMPGLLPVGFRVANRAEVRAAIERAYADVFADAGDPHNRWSFAEAKRRRDVDRHAPVWDAVNPELARFIEAYEAELRLQGLIDFDDMPLIAFRMIKAHAWIRDALRARFPVLFVDEYQDLGHALHELVLMLCFDGGIRLFAVGDVDQSIYSFTGANPELLLQLTARDHVRTIRLRFNYRSGAKIIRASLGALGEDRDYRGADGAPEGTLTFFPVNGGHDTQARYVATTVLSQLRERGFTPDKIAILYRAAWLGDKIAQALDERDIPYVRTDANALVKRNSRLARFIEACAGWVSGGWRDATPPYERLFDEALSLVFGPRATEAEALGLSAQLMAFLRKGIEAGESTHAWLMRFTQELVVPWRAVARNPYQEWEVCADMVQRTNPATVSDMPLSIFAGRIEGTGRATLSTFHSAKGREFDAVVMFGVNDGDLPGRRDMENPRALREARRLFYVGVTRPRKELCLVYRDGHHSAWMAELYARSQKM